MESLHGFDFLRLHFDADGVLQDAAAFQELKSAGATDIILIAHGFRNDENDATSLYDRFFTTFRDHMNSGAFPGVASRKIVVGGIYWPSKPYQETFPSAGATESVDPDLAQKEAIKATLEDLKATVARPEQKPKLDAAIALLDQVKDSTAAQDQFANQVLSLLDGSEPDPTEGADRVRATAGSVLLDKLKVPIIVASANRQEVGTTLSIDDGMGGGGTGGTQSMVSAFGSVFGRIGQFLNLTTWYVMKNRSGVVGGAGVAQMVRDLKTASSTTKIQLVGHSLGGRLMAGCVKSLAQTNNHVESLSLLEAAFSHYGFSANNGRGQTGFFRAAIDKQVVTGPLIATFSAQDTVVGMVYAVASRLASDSSQAIGDASDPFGGIGRNGAQQTTEAMSGPLHAVGTVYQFQPAKIECLDGSGGLIKDHGDVTNPFVTYAVASAISET
jgi:hypothetical protein